MIFIGADHRGFAARDMIIAFLKSKSIEVVDCTPGPFDQDDDFPLAVKAVVSAMKSAKDSDAMGILLCGSGQGVTMAANRFKGIRAALGYNEATVRSARNDDDANVLCLPAELSETEHKNIVLEFLNSSFAAAPRFIRRIKEMDEF